MKPLNSPKPLPAAIVKHLGRAMTKKGEALVLLLDGIPCVDVEAATPTRFAEKMVLWKRCIYPSLARSDVRYFHAVKESNNVECISVTEITFPKIK
jgi:hypothetical protein